MPPIPGRKPLATNTTSPEPATTTHVANPFPWQVAHIRFPISVENGMIISKACVMKVEVLAPLAIHPQLYGGPGWAITHLPTHCKLISMPDRNGARDVTELLWMVAREVLSLPTKHTIDLGLLEGDLAWVKPWLGACMRAGQMVPTVPYEGA